MSGRAAWRLESLGFTQVFRYTPGKADWLANGLPVEGKLADAPCVGDLARRDVPVCHLVDRVGEVRERIWGAGWEVGVVVNNERIVLGLLRGTALNSDPQATVEQMMESGPRTYRLDVSPEKAAEYMRKQGIDSVLVTTSDGQLVGLLKQEDV